MASGLAEAWSLAASSPESLPLLEAELLGELPFHMTLRGCDSELAHALADNSNMRFRGLQMDLSAESSSNCSLEKGQQGSEGAASTTSFKRFKW